MYFNNVHIVFYLLIAVLGFAVGKFIAWCNECFPKEEKIFRKDFFKANKEGLENNYILMCITAIMYVALLYKFGIKNAIYQNLDLIKYLILTPMLISAFFVDLKHRIIPNRLNLTIFETGLIFVFLYGINNINIAKDMLFGMLAGAGIFVAITLLGGLIAGKEAMGFGDVKFMGAIGLYFGAGSIAEISLLAFCIAAVLSIIILLIRFIMKKDDEYIPFGPFLVIAAVFCIFAPTNTVFIAFLSFCQMLSDKLLNVL